jgi:tRNA(Ser,Leu) C12 N-acetylase TAN1
VRALLAIENLGEEPLNTTLRDAWCNPVELVITPRVGKNNPVTPTDDDRAMALATLIEYLSGDYDVGIVIARDRRVEILTEHYIKQLREGRDFCHVIRDSDFRARCYEALNMPSGHRSRKLLTFNVIRTTTFMAGERELAFYLRGALYFLTGVRLGPREAVLLIDYIRNGWRGGGPELLGEQGPEPSTGCTPPQATTDFNLVVSVWRNTEYHTARELRRVGNALGNPVLDVMPTGFDGLVTARVRDPVGFVHGLRRLVDTGYALQYILRAVPVEAVVRPGINDIASTVVGLSRERLGPGEVFEVVVRKRGVEVGRAVIERAVVNRLIEARLGSTARLVVGTDRVVWVEVFPAVAGVAVIGKRDVFSVQKP